MNLKHGAIASFFGATVGLLAPIPHNWSDSAQNLPQRLSNPHQDLSISSLPDKTRKLCFEEVQELREVVNELELARDLAKSSFEREWGTIPQTPAGWDPVEERRRLENQVRVLEPISYLIDCDFYPCITAIADAQAEERKSIAETFSVPEEFVGISTMEHRNNLIYLPVVGGVVGLQKDGPEDRWVNNRRARLYLALMEQISIESATD